MMEYMLEGKSKRYATREQAEEAARELSGSGWDHPPVTILEVRPVAVCSSRPTGVKFRIASSSELVGPTGWSEARRRTRALTRETTIKEI